MVKNIASTMSMIDVAIITSMIVKPSSSCRGGAIGSGAHQHDADPWTQTLKVLTTEVALFVVMSHTVKVCRPTAQLFEPDEGDGRAVRARAPAECVRRARIGGAGRIDGLDLVDVGARAGRRPRHRQVLRHLAVGLRESCRSCSSSSRRHVQAAERARRSGQRRGRERLRRRDRRVGPCVGDDLEVVGRVRASDSSRCSS